MGKLAAKARSLPWAALAFGAAIFLILPAGVVVVNDDFGYLRSVVQTLQHGRPWTDDWLEPWAAGLSVLSALIFKITGSFYFAIHGVIAACAAVAFQACSRLLGERGFSRGRAAILTALLLTCPTILWKSLEFTGVVLYLPCLLLAVRAAERKAWGAFLAVWALAVATRQSALVWLVLPACEIVRALVTREPTQKSRGWLVPAAVVALGGLLFAVLQRGMNRTHAQARLTDLGFDHPGVHFREHVGAERFFGTWLTGVVVFAVAVGLSALVRRWTGRGKIELSLVRCALGASVVVSLWVIPGLGVEHTSYLGSGRFYLWGLVLVGATGWILGVGRLSLPLLAAAAASIALLSLRGGLWDYYLLDAAVFGFFCSRERPDELPEKLSASPAMSRVFAPALLGAILLFHASCVREFKLLLDRSHALITLAETALRAEKIRASEISFTPFGYIGWQFFPYYITRAGKNDPNIARFALHVGSGAVRWEQSRLPLLERGTSSRSERSAHAGELLAEGRFRLGWLARADFQLWRIARVDPVYARLKYSPADYRRPVFPLNDAEWRELIERR